MNTDSSLTSLIEKVEALCAAGQLSQPYLVSSLGLELGDDLHQIKNTTKMNLAEFIRTHLGDKYEIARLGEHSNVLAVIAVGSEAPDLVRYEGEYAIDTQGRPKFHYRLWAAFSVPPTHPYRILNLADLTFNDTAEAPVSLLEDKYLIPTQNVPPADEAQRDNSIYENLKAWLEEHNLPASRFFAKNDRRSKFTAIQNRSDRRETLLHAVLDNLDRKQLQSTSLGLDVVEALLKVER